MGSAAALALWLTCAPWPGWSQSGEPGANTGEPETGITEAVAVAAPENVGSALEVRYLANEGFLVESGGRRVLIDGLFGTGLSGYPAVPGAIREELEAGTGAWSGIKVALATHFHGDHFDPDAVGRFLAANPDAVFISTPQAIALLTESLASTGAPSESRDLLGRTHTLLPEEGSVQKVELDGIRIEALNLHHGRRTPPVENLGFVVTIDGKRFVHFGDTEATMEDFGPYLGILREPDLALLPFWFLSSEWRAQMVREEIRPRAIVVAHLPTSDAPASYFGRWESYDQLIRLIRAGFPDARFPHATGEAFGLEPDL